MVSHCQCDRTIGRTNAIMLDGVWRYGASDTRRGAYANQQRLQGQADQAHS